MVVMGSAPLPPHRGFASNVAAFVLRPKVTSAGATAAEVTLTVDPPVRAGQRVTLLLNTLPTAPKPLAYAFPDEPQDEVVDRLAMPRQQDLEGANLALLVHDHQVFVGGIVEHRVQTLNARPRRP